MRPLYQSIISIMCRVAQSKDTRMDITNLARVFGPTILGHAVPDPDPMTILQDTKRQPKVSDLKWGLGCAKCTLLLFDVFTKLFFPPLSLSQVVERLLSLPVEYWSRFMFSSNNNQGRSDHHDHRELQCPRNSWSESIIFIAKHLIKKKNHWIQSAYFFFL